MSFQTHTQGSLVFLTSPLLTGVRHGFSTRRGGVSPAPWDSLNLGPGRGDGPACLMENYRRFCTAIGTEPERTVLSQQVHETTVRLCTAEDAGKGLLRERDYTADALITREPGLALTVFSADCGILLLHDPVHHAVGALHAGWRGCAGGIVEKTVHAMESHFGSRAEDLQVAIGPCIGRCCFETDADVPAAMEAALGADAAPYLEQRGAKWHVDLAGLNRQWLLRSGVRPEHIDVCGLCTICHPDLFWSHRKMGQARGLQCAMIALEP
ncbi:MAG: peptidoglycan editing factor PgeF [Dysosmobacter sp.]|jgi:YfiH family protein|uniref:peptidoglycan editing factor PgeF n=1 Tax=Dysosmobacter sp. TaxID=2591382 RepID=UPI003D91E7AC